jgi:HEAT repeat protein
MQDGEPPHLEDDAISQLQRLEQVLTDSESLEERTAAIETGTAIAHSDWELGAIMLDRAASSDSISLRLWAAVLLTDAHEIPRDTYLDLVGKLLEDDDASVRVAALETLVWHESRADLRWSEVAPLIRRVL